MTEDLMRAGSLDELYALLKPLSTGPGWNKPTPSLWDEPRKTFVPFHWRYAQAKAALTAAGRLTCLREAGAAFDPADRSEAASLRRRQVNTELAERRNLILFNPIPGNDYATTRTLLAAYQMILPQEKARSHRHTPNALRLIVDADDGAYTIVDGVKLMMRPGDVLLTPNWCWHGHGNESSAPAYWIDFLDTPLIHALEPMFFEPHPQTYEPVTRTTLESPMRFGWEDTLRRLRAAQTTASDPYATQIELGAPAMATISLHMIHLQSGVETAAHRTTASNIYAVAQGHGASVVDGQSFVWSRGDVIAVPAWRPHSHCANEDSVLLRVSDEPVLQKLDLLRCDAG